MKHSRPLNSVELVKALMGLLAILSACGFWFLMLWFGTKE